MVISAPEKLQTESARLVDVVDAADSVDAIVRAKFDPLAVRPKRALLGILFVTLAWILLTVIMVYWPDTRQFRVEGTLAFSGISGGIAVLSIILAIIIKVSRKGHAVLARGVPWTLALAVWFVIWEITTAKCGWLKPPFFAAPQQLFYEAFNDRAILADSLYSSLSLLISGYVIGLLSGIIIGMWIGWSHRANYWVHPLLIYIGPVPAIAWIPIVFVAAPTSYAGAVFLIALTVWFPVTLLTRAGVVSTPRAYYDLAQTLGARTGFLIFRVSLPAALPNIFTGAFMGLGMSFATLTVAENFGVNAGLGWYINWKKGWSAYPAMYAAIAIMVLFCGGLLLLLLKTRARALRWQKDLTRW